MYESANERIGGIEIPTNSFLVNKGSTILSTATVGAFTAAAACLTATTGLDATVFLGFTVASNLVYSLGDEHRNVAEQRIIHCATYKKFEGSNSDHNNQGVGIKIFLPATAK